MVKKQFKDPIYGYIKINSNIVSEIIDTPVFQRLKDIKQTSYSPLYPAAYHNRYVHSLGVYHLGQMAFEAVKPQFIEISKNTELCNKVELIQKIFELACLLHDVGHAPFSHTGEEFFLDKRNIMYQKLKDCVNDDKFSEDFEALGTKKPAPHECMSCIVGINAFPSFFETTFEKNLFARCIIGMNFRFVDNKPEYKATMGEEERQAITRQREQQAAEKRKFELLNCIVNLLNSSIIDVDRLDYIIRDATTIGFKNVEVDYLRLLKGIRIVSFEKVLHIGYHKSALSVIESAIYAHDAEKKWVQGHPSILYEMEALKSAMNELTKIFSSENDPNPIFCYEALTEQGKKIIIKIPLFSSQAMKNLIGNNFWVSKAKEFLDKGELFDEKLNIDTKDYTICREYPISLLADEDVLYLIKSFCKKGLGFEYFARNRRRSAAWKSEAEFRALFQERIGDDTRNIKTLEKDFETLVDYCQQKTGVPIVDENIFDILNQEEREAKSAKKNKEIDNDSYEDIIDGIKTKHYWATVLKEIADSLKIEFEFLIVFQKKFNSSFKETIGNIPIIFPNVEDEVVPLKSVIDVLKSSADKKSNFFHLFYKSNLTEPKEKKKIVNTISKKLIDAINHKGHV